MSDRITHFSPCRKWRYTLWREFHTPDLFAEMHSGKKREVSDYLMVIGLNPSTADETQDDPTIRRCIDFAKRWGFGALCMTNLFAWRDTKPERMKLVENPAGIDNHHHILRCAASAGMVLAAWGKDGKHHCQDLNVRQWLNGIGVTLHALKINKDGSPMHPLYVPAHTEPVRYP